MADNTTVIKADEPGQYHLPNVARANVAKVDIADVDIIVDTKDGHHYLLPGSGIAAMGQNPPPVVFRDGTVSADTLMNEVGAARNLSIAVPSPTTIDSKTGKPVDGQAMLKAALAQQKAEEAHLKAEIAHQKAAELAHKTAELNKSHDHDHQPDANAVSALSINSESSVQNLVEQAQKAIDDTHKHDFDFVPPHQYQPPPAAFAAPPGVEPPISLTPIVTLFMGNVLGTVYDSTTMPGTTFIYGGGGAAGSDTSAQLGPRSPLQFSTATIDGTAGNDVIYAEGNVGGNGNAQTMLYAKEFALNVAGYFTTLNDVVISNVPAGITVAGATQQANGSWVLPADTVLKQGTFQLIYNTTAASSTGTFDIQITVSGSTQRHVEFTTTQNFRFEYLNVTNVSQVTDQTLVYDYQGQLKEVYVLPTQDQPNLITTGDGNDIVYGSRSSDTIMAGSGNDGLYGGDGDDVITTGDGANTVDGGGGNNIITTGAGNDVITVGDGANTIVAGNGNNSVTVGNGVNSITTGTGNDTITAGIGNNIITDTGGNNTIIVGADRQW